MRFLSTDLGNLLFKFRYFIFLWKYLCGFVFMALDHNTVVLKIFIDFIFYIWVWFIFTLFEIRVVIKSIDWMWTLLDDVEIIVSV